MPWKQVCYKLTSPTDPGQVNIIGIDLSRHKGSHLHNNDASLVIAQRARVVLAVRIGTPSSARARAGQPGGVACNGDDARGSVSFDPQRMGALLSYAYGLMEIACLTCP